MRSEKKVENRRSMGETGRMYEDLLKLLRLRRSELGLTQKDVADAMGIKGNTLSNWETGRTCLDLDTYVKLCGVYALDASAALVTAYGLHTDAPTAQELGHLRALRALDAHGRSIVELLLEAETARITQLSVRPEPLTPATRIIPLFVSPAAAGYASPVLGEDYTEYEIPFDSRGDFAARISGDSMEPYIADGSIVLVTRTLDLVSGDVGLFCVDNDIFCKQYCEDCYGNIYLFSLNRARADADLHIPADSGRTVFCCGKVLLDRRPPLP